MCGEEPDLSARTSQGGAIAIIHMQQQLRLLFRNPEYPATAPTRLRCEIGSPEERNGLLADGLVMQIQYTLPFHRILALPLIG